MIKPYIWNLLAECQFTDIKVTDGYTEEAFHNLQGNDRTQGSFVVVASR